jgi:hypothetical protein
MSQPAASYKAHPGAPRLGREVILIAMRMLAAFLLAAGCAAAAPQYSGELIFPLEKWHNHSSSIVELPNGDLLVCWFHGSGERTADDVLIQAARWNRATGKWTAPFTLAGGARRQSVSLSVGDAGARWRDPRHL